MPAHEPLNLAEQHRRIVVGNAIVEPQKDGLQLRHNHILIIPLVADHRALVLRHARDIERDWRQSDVLAQRIAEDESLAVGLVHVRLIVRAAAVHAVEIERWRAEVDQPVRIVTLLQAAGGIEGDVMIDELAEIRVAG